MKPIKFQSKVLENTPLSEGVKHLVFTVPENFSFIPGQYVSLIVDKDGKKFRRPYSIASKPRDNTIEICVKIIANGLVTPYIDKFQEGDEIEILGPFGHFIVGEESKNKDLIFISAGTGVGPFRSIINHLLENNFKKNITLVAGYRKNILYDEEFKELEKKHKNFKYEVAISSQGKRVTNILPINKQADYYVCGLLEMINSVRALLVKEGVAMSSIMAEKYD